MRGKQDVEKKVDQMLSEGSGPCIIQAAQKPVRLQHHELLVLNLWMDDEHDHDVDNETMVKERQCWRRR